MANPMDARDVAARAAATKTNPVGELKTGHDVTKMVPKWDRYVSGSEAAAGGIFGDALLKHEKSTAWAAFARETFANLYDSGMSRDLTAAERPKGSDWVDQLHQAAESLPEMKALKARARRDAWACGVAAGEALNVLASKVKPPESDPQAIQDELEFIQGLMAGDGTGKKKTSAAHLRRLAALKRQVQDAEAEHARATQLLAANGAEVRSALRAGAMKASEAIDEMDAAMSTLGCGDGAGSMSRVSAPPQVLRTAVMRNAKLRRVLKIAGRMKASAIQKQRTKARPGAEELCDIRTSSDVARLLPSELVNLASEETEVLLYRKLMEASAMTYELRGKETRAEGPILLAVDESGSMSGEPDCWAKAVAFALMEIAARQNRSFAYIHFDARVSRVDEVTTPKSVTIQQLEELVSYFTGGGTDIGRALEHCLGMLKGDASKREATGTKPWKRADVILVTDGVDGSFTKQEAAIKAIKAMGGHVYGVFIGTPPGALGGLCDEVVEITGAELRSGDPRHLGEMFAI
jgi:uncharacterized protein with von Willebrand factor type A (vWA) domain